MPESDKKDREPSLFSWLSFSRNPYERQVQMSPISAMMQTQAISTVKRLITGVGMIAIVLAVVAGTVNYLQRGSSINASFNLKQSVSGIVLAVDQLHNSFSLLYLSSFDTRVAMLGKSKWTVLLPPGTSFADSQTGKSICLLVSDLSGNLSDTVTSTCSHVVVRGKKLLIEYLFLTPDKDQLVAKTIIGEK